MQRRGATQAMQEAALHGQMTILIPTMNRAEFVMRILRYYSELGFTGCLAIGDSSEEEHARRIQRAVAQFRTKLNVVYYACPGLTEPQACQRMLKDVSTP
jgi:hypothetical protein